MKSCKDLRTIISSDNEMSFISRDQITLNEDNDILIKFSNFFKLDTQTSSTPFQARTLDQITKTRIRSAGYRLSTHHNQLQQQPSYVTTHRKPSAEPKKHNYKENEFNKMLQFLQMNEE